RTRENTGTVKKISRPRAERGAAGIGGAGGKGNGADASRLLQQHAPQGWLDYCKDKRPDLDPAETYAAFFDYWPTVPGKKGDRVSWLPVWRNWVRMQRAPPRARTPIDFAAIDREVERRAREETAK